jgi:hypothetical protein
MGYPRHFFNHLRKKRNPEGILQLQIIRYIKSKGGIVGKTKVQGTYDQVARSYRFDPFLFLGFADLTAFIPHLVFIEVKAPKGVQSDHQKSFQECCTKAGIPYILARSLSDIEKLFC